MLDKVEEIRHDTTTNSHSKNRLGVLLGNIQFDKSTKTLTHVLWSLLNSIPGNSVQRPHRHNSVALDLCVSASPGVYTLMGRDIDSEGNIINPIKCDWVSGGVFVTPPGWWHSHHNTSDDVAWVLPIQDAGLYTYQRTLDIRFVDDEINNHANGKIRGSTFIMNDEEYNIMKDNIEGGEGKEEEGEKEKDKKELVKESVLSSFITKHHRRRASIQVGSLAREQYRVSTTTTSSDDTIATWDMFSTHSTSWSIVVPTAQESSSKNQRHRRRQSIQVGALSRYMLFWH